MVDLKMQKATFETEAGKIVGLVLVNNIFDDNDTFKCEMVIDIDEQESDIEIDDKDIEHILFQELSNIKSFEIDSIMLGHTVSVCSGDNKFDSECDYGSGTMVRLFISADGVELKNLKEIVYQHEDNIEAK